MGALLIWTDGRFVWSWAERPWNDLDLRSVAMLRTGLTLASEVS